MHIRDEQRHREGIGTSRVEKADAHDSKHENDRRIAGEMTHSLLHIVPEGMPLPGGYEEITRTNICERQEQVSRLSC